MTRSASTDRGEDISRFPGSLRTLFAVGSLCGLTDGQLLERFLRGRGDADAEAAFTALVERHGPMVLGVCRAVLGDRHDAEDACQAAFLVLARRAGTIRRGDSVASWLYGVARRLALRARRDAARRRALERRRMERTGSVEPVSAPPSEPWPELYEELDRLPQPFRAAVVLCDLEGHSYEQAAGLLHCPVGTLQSRLARGRERLRLRLERRGIAPAVALVGSGAVMSSLSPQLTAAIARAAIGIGAGRTIAAATPSAVAAMAGAEVRRQIMRRILATLMLLAMTGMAAAAAIVLSAAGHAVESRPQAPVAAKTTEAGPIHVRVVDVNGEPAPGIAIEAYRDLEPPRSFSTDADGRAEIPRDVIDEWGFLLARSGPDAIAWGSAPNDTRPERPSGAPTDPFVMKLLPVDHRVEGSVVDREGRPIPGVAMRAVSFNHPINGSIAVDYTLLRKLLDPAITDRAGRFAIRVPREAHAGFKAAHPRYVGPFVSTPPDTKTLAPTTLVPAGGITGRVTDAATGQPVAGAAILARLLQLQRRTLSEGERTVTDQQGRFTITGLEPGVYGVLLRKVPGRANATAAAVEGVRVRAGADSTADLAVIEGRPLRGGVVDRETGRPVPGIEVSYHGPALPPLLPGIAEVRKTDEHGRFTFHVVPGEQYVEIRYDSENSRMAHRYVEVPERGEIEPILLLGRARVMPPPVPIGVARKAVAPRPAPAVAKAKVKSEASEKAGRPAVAKVDNEAKPADPETRTVIGRVRDAQGKPVPGIRVFVQGPGDFDHTATDRDGVFELPGLPRNPIHILLSRRQGKFQSETLAADRDRVEFTLRPEIVSPPHDRPEPPKDEPIPPGLRDRLTFVDLDTRGTDFLADGPAEGGNDLNRLPHGIHKLGETYFRIGEKMVHLKGRLRPELPQAVKGIKVQARGRMLHFLHSTQYGGDSSILIGAYVVHYADGSSERVPIAYGRSLVNWWKSSRTSEEPTEARVAWTGTNDASDLNPGLKIRLFDMTWTNPHPDREIATLDVLANGKDCDPFLVGVTVVRP